MIGDNVRLQWQAALGLSLLFGLFVPFCDDEKGESSTLGGGNGQVGLNLTNGMIAIEGME